MVFFGKRCWWKSGALAGQCTRQASYIQKKRPGSQMRSKRGRRHRGRSTTAPLFKVVSAALLLSGLFLTVFVLARIFSTLIVCTL
ncbi:uncharacterized protein K452DRAFT_2145 [Aplosporella prunicola CBS 121167]|uniref:Uncharacterized protein n=1 Tax=Aplosporella prunicola CBS 121167 TaxID=1176127 RepID=A0A6A6BT14_9PEZI|nr:uncharacterized protein K452DRAFT_2145 [Aplosporella prunicola CBS 121167]KAF2147130.1 hypothetical protein K452DRAFT_2145 [Aplosporella prunicola CBS 121167]